MNNKSFAKKLGYNIYDQNKVMIDDSDDYINIKINDNLYFGSDQYCESSVFYTLNNETTRWKSLLNINLSLECNEICISVPFYKKKLVIIYHHYFQLYQQQMKCFTMLLNLILMELIAMNKKIIVTIRSI